MATIDDKVVSASFESSKFEEGVNKTISAIDKLKAALHFPEAGKGLDDINQAASRVDLSHIGRGIEAIKGALGALRLVAIGVFTHIANMAVDAGARFVKSFVIDPVVQGFQEYATNLNAIQTILANTQASGAGLKEVNAALNDLNHYSDKTIYNFSQMAKNIGTFTAAGVDLDTSTQAIKGIANLAALSGSNADQASTAMYQLSQAIAAGSVKLQDWNSVVNAGMGGTVFQRALAQTAEAMGTLNKGAVKLTGPMKNVTIAGEAFRQSLSTPGKASWLTSKVLTTTLKQFTGDLTDAQLHAQGFNDAQIKAIQQTAKTAMHAATEVKTLSQVLDVAKETAGSGWAQTWQIIFGDFGEAKTTFTALSNSINGFINSMSNARNKVLADWKALGGRVVLIDGIKTAFKNLGEILKPIREAFRDIFPATTGKQLFELTKRFEEFAKALKPSPETIDGLRRTFRGLFAVLDIGKQLIGGIFTVFAQWFHVVGQGSGGFLKLTGSIGDFLVSVDEALKKGDRLHNFFVTLGKILAAPLQLLSALGTALSKMFSGFSPGGFFGQMDGLTKKMTPFQKIMEGVSTVWNKFLDGVRNSGDILKPAVEAIAHAIEGIGTAIGNAASNMNFDAILQVIRTGLFATLVLMFKNFFGSGSFVKQLTQGFSGGVFSNITKSFGSLQGTMVSLQNNIKAKTLKEIAIAIGILAASVVALSLVDPAKLKASLGAMTIAFGELIGAMALLTTVTKSMGFIKLPFIASSLIILAGAIDTLTIAVVALSFLSWEKLLKGLTGVGVLLGVLVVAAVPLSASSAGLIRAGIGITAIAIALNLLAFAMRSFGGMSWTEMGKGLAGVAGGLVALGIAAKAMPPGTIAMGIGLIAVATGLKILATVVKTFAGMDWRSMGKGLLGVGGALVVIAGAMQLMPTSMVVTAAGLVLVSFALGKIANAVMKMSGMSIKEIAKGLGTLAGALAILAAALYLMSGTLAGSVALGVAAASIALLAPALTSLGKQSWTQIIKGLVTLGAALAVIGIAGALITPVIPSLLGLGVALILLGGGLALAGAGIFLISAGLSALVVALPTGVGVLVAALQNLLKAIPEIVKNLLIGLLQIVDQLAATAPKFVDALIKILDSLIEVIIKASPRISVAMDALLTMMLQVFHDNEPKIIQAGFDLLLAVLNGIKANIGQVVSTVVSVITKFLGAIVNNLNKIIQAGGQILTALIKGIVGGYAGILTTVLGIFAKFLTAIASNLGKVATAGLSILTSLLKAIANGLGNVIKAGTDVIVKFVEGIGNAGARIVAAATDSMIKFINSISKNSVKLIDAGAQAILYFLNGVAAAINKYAPQMRAAGISIGVAIADGMTFGLVSKAGDLAKKAADIGHGALSALKHAVGAHSPSKAAFEIGGYVIEGLANGMADSKKAVDAATKVSKEVIGAFNETFQTASPSKVMIQIGQYVGQGFAQGLTDSQDSIRSSFTDLNNKLTEAMQAARETIASEQDKLDKLRAAKKPDAAAIAAAQKIIAENQDLLARSTAGHIALTKTLKDEKATLIGLVGDYEKIGERLKNAQQALVDAKKARDDAVKGFTDQFDALPDIVTQDADGNAIDQLAAYEEALKHQADAVGAYKTTLDQLRKLGLDDATYQKLLADGTADQQFASQLLSGGKNAVAGLNTLDTQLQKVSKSLAVSAGKNLYQAGVDAAQGLVNGLASKKSALHKAIEDLADEMLATLKAKLKIKSPSEAFAEIGRYSMEGMAKGFSDGSQMVTDAVDSAAKDALTAMKLSMGDISSLVTDEIDPNPVITPILDLTQVRSQAEELGTLTAPIPITAAASYGQASIISTQQNTVQDDQTAVAPGGTSVKFEQNNYSPEALTEIEIYRQTKNQLSQLKSALALT